MKKPGKKFTNTGSTQWKARQPFPLSSCPSQPLLESSHHSPAPSVHATGVLGVHEPVCSSYVDFNVRLGAAWMFLCLFNALPPKKVALIKSRDEKGGSCLTNCETVF